MKNIYIVLGILAVLLLGYFLVIKEGTHESEQIVCTADALICPDGSGVGRDGPNCEFATCPNKAFFSGELIQQGSDFFLAIDAPKESVEEVTYSLPLKLSRTSNAVGTLVGKQVRVTGSFSTGSTLEVETLEADKDDTSANMKVGETKFINGVRVTLNKIVEDSRCPSDVVCVWAGRLVVSLTLKSDTDEETLNLESGETPHGFDIFKVYVESATPKPVSTKPIPPSEFSVFIRVEK